MADITNIANAAIEALNARDFAALAGKVHEDVAISGIGEGMDNGREALRERLARHFEAFDESYRDALVMTDAGGTIAINPPNVEPAVTVALRSKAFSTVCPDAQCPLPGPMRFIASGDVVGRAFIAPAAVATPVPTLAPWGLALLSLLLAPLAWLNRRRQR